MVTPETYHGGWTPWRTVHRYYVVPVVEGALCAGSVIIQLSSLIFSIDGNLEERKT